MIDRPFRVGALDAGRQELLDRIARRHFPPERHVGQNQRGEHLRDRADLEDCVAVELYVDVDGAPVRQDAPAFTSDQTDDETDRPMVDVDAIGRMRLTSSSEGNPGRGVCPRTAVAASRLRERSAA